MSKSRPIFLLFLASAVVLLLALPRCISRTVTSQRFQESVTLRPFLREEVKLSDPDHFTFAIVGDLHIGGGDTLRFRRILAEASAESDAFIILLGDLVDQGARSDMVALKAALNDMEWARRAFPVIGNHDIFYDGWSAYRELFGPSHYTFRVGNTRFIALDTADGSVGAEQESWLEEELGKPAPAHTFLLSHYLPTTPGQQTYLKLANGREAARLMKIAAQDRVTGWLGAHYHSFLKGDVEGVTYVVAGGGGGRRMEPVKSYFFVQVSINQDQVSYHLRVLH